MPYNKIYSATYIENLLAPGAFSLPTFALNSSYQNMRIKSITLNLLMNTAGTSIPLPEAMNNTQLWYLRVGAMLPARSPLYTKTFSHISGTAPAFSGSQVLFSKTGQYLFDSWFINETITFQLVYGNLSAVNYAYTFSILVETEEKLSF